MILVCGGLADPVTEVVCARIEQLGFTYHLLNLGIYPEGYVIDWQWVNGGVEGTITAPDWRLRLHDISGIFFRYLEPGGHAPIPSVPSRLEQTTIDECQAGIVTLLECFPGQVANRVSSSLSNQSKPYQAMVIRNSGLKIPRTLITSDPNAARAFHDSCAGEVIFKSISSTRSIVRRMGPRDLERLPLLRECPAQFQEFVPGDDIRVHVVGEEIFATRARTDAVDYRYARQQGHELNMEPTILPEKIAEACLNLSRKMGLAFSGIDLKHTPQDEYYCFEVNPSPGFIFYERHTGQPISTALVRMLRGMPE